MRVRTLVGGSAAALIAWTQVGYPATLLALRPRRAQVACPAGTADEDLPTVALIIPAHAEAGVIAAKIANARALDYPQDRLTIVVACDGSTDGTAEVARAAGADLVLELPRGGKVATQDAAVASTDSEVVAFGDANALWQPDALRELVVPLACARVGYVCGRVTFTRPDRADNQEGVYWRYEMMIRARESALCSVTAGNGAIYAVRRAAYVELDPRMGHDLALPFTLVRAGWRCVEAERACALEPMVPDLAGEAKRKRRMQSHAWAIVLGGGLLDPRGWPPIYIAMMISHRWLRYSTPFLHLLLFAACGRRLKVAQLLAALPALPQRLPLRWLPRPLRRVAMLARYYGLMQSALMLGLYDHLRHGTEVGWASPEGTRVAADA